MTEAELMALVALTQQETVLRDGANAMCALIGESPAYGDDYWGPYHRLLHIEMESRGLLQELGK